MLVLLSILTTLALGGSSSAVDPPPAVRPPAVVVLDELEDLYWPVEFDHQGHAGMAAMGDGCAVCHHNSPEETPYPACRSCHAEPVAQSIDMPGLKGAYHRQCLSCHIEWTHRTACNVCHLPKSGADADTGPFHEFDDLHSSVQAQGAMVFQTEHEAPVITFRHVDHTRVFGLDCADCHQGETCADCHDHGESASSSEHSGLRNRCYGCHNVQGKQDCRFCHQAVAQSESFNHEEVVGWSLEPDHADLACASCHGAADVFDTPTPECYACHAEMGIKGFDHLSLDPERDCGECHGQVVGIDAGASYPHPSLEQGCGACHDPGCSNEPFHLLADETALCFSCHEDVLECYRSATVVHGPEDGHRCTTCHKPHGSNYPRLLRNSREALCLDCHDRSIEANDGHILTNIAARLLAGSSLHGPVREGDCMACHQPHASVNDRLLQAAYPASFYASYDDDAYDLCFSCHVERLTSADAAVFDTGFHDGEVNLHWMHLKGSKGRACGACHDPHASELPFFIRESVRFGNGQWSFSMGYEQTFSGGRCAPACHEPMEYRRGELLTRFD